MQQLGICSKLDVVDDVSITRAVARVNVATGGHLDFLVNNSGGGKYNIQKPPKLELELTIATGYSMALLDAEKLVAKKMFDVNGFALVAVTQAFAPLLISSKGTITNIGSVLGYMPLPWQGYYNASKAAANLLSDQFRVELSPFGVKTILVVSGIIKTKFFENLPNLPTLPPDSLYYTVKDDVEPVMAGGESEKSGVDVDVYANSVVSNALKANPKKRHWVGGSASTFWFTSTFGWSTIWVRLVSWVFREVRVCC